MPGKFFELDGVAVDVDVALTKFECDLSQCKGACCTMESDFGAPVDENEIERLEKRAAPEPRRQPARAHQRHSRFFKTRRRQA